MSSRIDFSIVIPFHDEEESVDSVIGECLSVLDQLTNLESEVVAVDDGSSDGTATLLANLGSRDERVRVLTFAQNQGQAPALFYGLRAARGNLVATLDGDGQNNPADFPAMIARLKQEDAGLVSGVRVHRHDSWLRRTMSRVANRVRDFFLNDGVTDSGCAIKVFRRTVVESLIPLKTLYSFIPALANAAGHRVVECPVDHRDRVGGRTHYGLRVMLWRPAVDMLGVWWFCRRRFPETGEIEGTS